VQKLFDAISVTAELMGQTISPNASAVMGADLKDYPRGLVFEALKNVRHAGGRFSIGAVINEIEKLSPDGRPGAEEAWAMIPRDEATSAVMTDEMAQAMGIAQPLLDEGDQVAARMSFKETYTRLVDTVKRNGTPVKWFPSLGSDKNGRAHVLNESVRLGRLSHRHVAELLPPPITSHDVLAVRILDGKLQVKTT
jgi:hypothetical protein